jgi:nucleotide-binding universal stress UspA family protein
MSTNTITHNISRSMNILLGFDGSQHAFAAIEMLRDLPLGNNSKVITLGVLLPRDSSNHAVMEAALDEADRRLKEQGLNSYTEMILGNPAEKIIDYAEQIKPDLIVAGAKGLRHTLGILLGGVAQQIVEYAKQPVLVVRAPYHGFKHLVFVTDGSISSRKTLEYLAGVAGDEHSTQCHTFPLPAEITVDVMHVLPPLPSTDLIARSWPIGTDVLPPVPLDRESEAIWLQEEEERGRVLLEQNISYLQKCSDIKAHPVLVRGDAATEIIQYANDHEVDLILAGSRGLSEIQSWLLGSVSRKLVHYARCSVLIVKH